MDINAIIKKAIEQEVRAAVAGNTEAMLIRMRRIEDQVSTFRSEIALLAGAANNTTQRLEELAHASAGTAAVRLLEEEVTRLRRHVEALDHAKAKDDERFQEDVVSVLDQDNMDAKIREVVADVLHEALPQAVADAFQNGELTISVDKV